MPLLRSLKKFFYTDRVVLCFLALGALINLVSWAFILWKVNGDMEWRATGYSVYFGATDFGPPQMLYRIPAVGSLIVVINVAIAYFLHKRDQSYARVLVGATAFLQVLIFIPLLAIYYFGNLV